MKFIPQIGLMGLSSDGMLITPSGKNLFKVPDWLGRAIQSTQHWIAMKTWR